MLALRASVIDPVESKRVVEVVHQLVYIPSLVEGARSVGDGDDDF